MASAILFFVCCCCKNIRIPRGECIMVIPCRLYIWCEPERASRTFRTYASSNFTLAVHPCMHVMLCSVSYSARIRFRWRSHYHAESDVNWENEGKGGAINKDENQHLKLQLGSTEARLQQMSWRERPGYSIWGGRREIVEDKSQKHFSIPAMILSSYKHLV